MNGDTDTNDDAVARALSGDDRRNVGRGDIGAELEVLVVEEVDAIVQAEGAIICRTGLVNTGDTFIVGADGLMRSDSRLFLENPEQYKHDVIEAGTPPDVAETAIRLGGTTLVQPAAFEANRAAQKGQ